MRGDLSSKDCLDFLFNLATNYMVGIFVVVVDQQYDLYPRNRQTERQIRQGVSPPMIQSSPFFCKASSRISL